MLLYFIKTEIKREVEVLGDLPAVVFREFLVKVKIRFFQKPAGFYVK